MRASGWTVGVLVIALAVVVALAQLLLPLVAHHPQWVAAQLSARAQRPVSFTSMEGRWTPSGPLFVLHGVTVGAPVRLVGSCSIGRRARTELMFQEAIFSVDGISGL